jgi:hypothetical protein
MHGGLRRRIGFRSTWVKEQPDRVHRVLFAWPLGRALDDLKAEWSIHRGGDLSHCEPLQRFYLLGQVGGLARGPGTKIPALHRVAVLGVASGQLAETFGFPLQSLVEIGGQLTRLLARPHGQQSTAFRGQPVRRRVPDHDARAAHRCLGRG